MPGPTGDATSSSFSLLPGSPFWGAGIHVGLIRILRAPVIWVQKLQIDNILFVRDKQFLSFHNLVRDEKRSAKNQVLRKSCILF